MKLFAEAVHIPQSFRKPFRVLASGCSDISDLPSFFDVAPLSPGALLLTMLLCSPLSWHQVQLRHLHAFAVRLRGSALSDTHEDGLGRNCGQKSGCSDDVVIAYGAVRSLGCIAQSRSPYQTAATEAFQVTAPVGAGWLFMLSVFRLRWEC